jgi:dihydroxyacetone kinase
MGRVDNSEPTRAASEEGRGVLVVVMNYTGDVLNFGLAVEKGRAVSLSLVCLFEGCEMGVLILCRLV